MDEDTSLQIICAMNESPEGFRGETVRIKGQMAVVRDTERIHLACVKEGWIPGQRAGLQFVLAGNHQIEEIDSLLGNEITVTGKLETYWENRALYCHLVDAVVSL